MSWGLGWYHSERRCWRHTGYPLCARVCDAKSCRKSIIAFANIVHLSTDLCARARARMRACVRAVCGCGTTAGDRKSTPFMQPSTVALSVSQNVQVTLGYSAPSPPCTKWRRDGEVSIPLWGLDVAPLNACSFQSLPACPRHFKWPLVLPRSPKSGGLGTPMRRGVLTSSGHHRSLGLMASQVASFSMEEPSASTHRRMRCRFKVICRRQPLAVDRPGKYPNPEVPQSLAMENGEMGTMPENGGKWGGGGEKPSTDQDGECRNSGRKMGGRWEKNVTEMGRNTHFSQFHFPHFPGGRIPSPQLPL